MTGASSFIVLGLAASLLAAGWLAIVGRRRNRKVVA
jgi:LPXTG-motif cell wall-anchored protein